MVREGPRCRGKFGVARLPRSPRHQLPLGTPYDAGATQKPTQQATVPACTGLHTYSQLVVGTGLTRPDANRRGLVHFGGMGSPGLERTPKTAGNTPVSDTGGSKSGNIGAGPGMDTPPTPTDPALASVVAAWPHLPPALRAGIVAMVQAATHPSGDR